MVQLLQQQALQTRGGLMFRGINSGFCQQLRSVYACLCQHLAETGVFRLQRLLFGCRKVSSHTALSTPKLFFPLLVNRHLAGELWNGVDDITWRHPARCRFLAHSGRAAR